MYYDTYVTMCNAEFHESVADVFGLDSAAEAARGSTNSTCTRGVCQFLTLRSNVDDSYTTVELTTMAQIDRTGAGNTGPRGSQTPRRRQLRGVRRRPRPVCRDCVEAVRDPCEAMKAELDDVLAAFPDGVPVGGIAGERSPEFCQSVGVNAAPAVVLFEDGKPVERITGRTDPSTMAEQS